MQKRGKGKALEKPGVNNTFLMHAREAKIAEKSAVSDDDADWKGLSYFSLLSHTKSPPALGLRRSLVSLGATDDYLAPLLGMLLPHFVAARNGDNTDVVCMSCADKKKK